MKIRHLIKALNDNGFLQVRQNGSHRVFKHSNGRSVVLARKGGEDALEYQIKAVTEAVKELRRGGE